MEAPKSYFDIQRIIRLFTRQEVKTPLSFLFKVVPYLVAAWIAILYSPISDQLKYTLVTFTSITLVVLCGVVLIFAWFKPTHLVYGEAGYRAERKMEFGTERKILTKEQLEKEESTEETHLGVNPAYRPTPTGHPPTNFYSLRI